MPLNPAHPAEPVGWPLLPVPDANGSLNWPDLETSVRQTIRALLITRQGEALLHPLLGGSLQDFVHQPNTVLTRKGIHDRIVETLRTWEPRVELTQLTVEPSGDFGERVQLTLDYRLRLTGQTGGLSIALTLGTEG
ncbi:MAG: GPW/gp25 family protein [Rhizobiaceae bacterium]